MEMNREIPKAVLKFLSGETKHVCRLCFSSTEEREISLEDNAMLKRIYCRETLTFSDMFKDLGVQSESFLPHVVCLSCATLTINTYLFQKLCRFSNFQWMKTINCLEKVLSQTNNVKSKTNTIFLILNNTDPLVFMSKKQHKEKIKIFAAQSIMNILRSRHWYRNKKKKRNDCENCSLSFKSDAELIQHNSIHSKKKFMCQHCGKTCSTISILNTHLKRIHCEKLLKCPKCNKKFSHVKFLQHHYKGNHIRVNCKICSKQFPTSNNLRTHMHTHAHMINCPSCGKPFQNKYSLKNHVKICGKEKHVQFFCDNCKKGYIRKNALRSHIRREHGFGKLYACEWCNKRYDAISQLKVHIVKHTKERNFHCEYCGGQFVTKTALRNHTRLHTGEKPYPCNYCDEGFVSASRRTEHMRKHLGPQRECSICNAKFYIESQLNRHIAKHSDPRSKLYAPEAVNIKTNSVESIHADSINL